MTTARGLGTAALLALLLVPAACASGGPVPPGTASDASGAPPTGEAPVLRVEHVGGFVTPEMLVARLPIISVYDDGRVITQGPQILVYPGPAWPNVQVQRIDAAAVESLVDRAVAAGVQSGRDLGQPPVADAPTTRFTVVTGEGRQVLDVAALSGAAADGSTLSAEQLAAREKLTTLLADLTDLTDLTDLSGTLGADEVSAAEPYVPDAVAATARPWEPGDAGVSAPPARPWPGPKLPGDPIGGADGPKCVTVTGAAAQELRSAAADANALTPWISGDDRWAVTFRPLLPDEAGCDALGEAP